MEKEREKLLESLKEQGLSAEILQAFATVKREDFIPEAFSAYAYDDIALPLEDGTTLSQPSTIAFMLNLVEIKENMKILEIGSGSGYVLALIKELTRSGEIYGLEINSSMAIKSTKILESNKNIKIINRSGIHGMPDKAPFDRILISASCPDRRIPYNLIEQLSQEGILISAVKQSIIRIKKHDNKIDEEEFPGFAFVPFVVEEK